MDTFSALLALCKGNPSVTGEFSSQKPVMLSFDVFFDLHLNKRLSKQSRPGDLRRHRANYDVTVIDLAHDRFRFGLISVRRQANIWTKTDLLLVDTLGLNVI